jgi:ATP-dependent helicase/nuclease subunit B
MLVQAGWQARCITQAFAQETKASGQPNRMPEVRVLGEWVAQESARLNCQIDELERLTLVFHALENAGDWVRRAAPSAAARIRLARTLIQGADDLLWAKALGAPQARTADQPSRTIEDAEIGLIEQIATVLSANMNPASTLQSCLAAVALTQVILVTVDELPQPAWQVAAQQLGSQALWLAPDYAQTKRALGGAFAQWAPEGEIVSAGSAIIQNAADRVEVRYATSLEREAQFAAQQVAQALARGCTQVSVVPLDRRVARRVQALLARRGIAVHDSAGWRLVTTAAATALARWFDWVLGERVADLLDWWRHPAVAAVHSISPELQDYVAQAARDASLVQGMQALHAALERSPSVLQAQALDHLRSLRNEAQQIAQSAAPAQHARTVQTALSDLLSVLATDSAGERVVAVLQRLSELETEQVQSGAEFWALFSAQMEQEFFAQLSASAAVSLATLAGAAFVPADAVVVLGASRQNLPTVSSDSVILPHALRVQLGLPQPDDGSGAFCALLSCNVKTTFTYTAVNPQQARFEASPWLLQLSLSGAAQTAALAPRPVEQIGRWVNHHVVIAPSPAAKRQLPEVITASGFEDLVVCPYRFFALRLLGLTDVQALSAQLDRSDYGRMAHRLLAWLHTQYPQMKDVTDDTILAAAHAALATPRGGSAMERAQRAAFNAMMKRWLAQYLVWAREREQQGWRIAGTEVEVERTMDVDGRPIHLRGRIDRLEKSSSGDFAVYDYKAQGANTVAQLAKEPLEAPQLAFYGNLLDAPVTDLGYVSLSADKVTQAKVAQPVQPLIATVNAMLTHLLSSVYAGAALPANGVASACFRCDAYGVCQRGYRR